MTDAIFIWRFSIFINLDVKYINTEVCYKQLYQFNDSTLATDAMSLYIWTFKISLKIQQYIWTSLWRTIAMYRINWRLLWRTEKKGQDNCFFDNTFIIYHTILESTLCHRFVLIAPGRESNAMVWRWSGSLLLVYTARAWPALTSLLCSQWNWNESRLCFILIARAW